MTMTRNFQTRFQTRRLFGQPRPVWLLALGLALTPWFSAAGWAETYNLQSVDFATAGSQTNIILHTGSIVPVQKVLISDTKLILDIDQVNTDDTVHTNFAGAGNISHVIMQPLSEHKIRMIIRGDGLGTPSVAFYNAGSGSYNNVNPDFAGSKLAAQAQTTLHQLQENGTKPATLSQPVATAEQPAVDNARPKEEEEEPIAFGGLVAPAGQHANTATMPAPTGKPALMSASETAPIPLQSGGATGGADALTHFFAQLAGSKLNGLLGLGLLAMALLGGGLTCYKVLKMKQGPPDLEDLMEEQSQGKRVSFREMANAYRSKHDPVERPSASKAGNRKANAEDVIGLRSLNQMENELDAGAFAPPVSPAVPPATQPATSPASSKAAANSLEQMIAAIQAANNQKQPVNTPAPKKQAVNQYLQNQQIKPKPAQKRPPLDETIVQEHKRAQLIQQEMQQQQIQRPQPGRTPLSKLPGAPVNQAAAAKKQVKAPNFQSIPSAPATKAQPRPTTRPNPTLNANQGPLPGNPEVLNFLRNVADLMEKDGKSTIAKSIHKNLNPKSAGLIQ